MSNGLSAARRHTELLRSFVTIYDLSYRRSRVVGGRFESQRDHVVVFASDAGVLLSQLGEIKRPGFFQCTKRSVETVRQDMDECSDKLLFESVLQNRSPFIKRMRMTNPNILQWGTDSPYECG